MECGRCQVVAGLAEPGALDREIGTVGQDTGVNDPGYSADYIWCGVVAGLAESGAVDGSAPRAVGQVEPRFDYAPALQVLFVGNFDHRDEGLFFGGSDKADAVAALIVDETVL